MDALLIYRDRKFQKRQDLQPRRRGGGSDLIIGRGGDLVLDSKEVGRRHARLTGAGGRFYIQDLRSTNGTTLNRQALPPNKEVELRSGDLIEIGCFAIRCIFAASGEEALAAPPPDLAEPPDLPARDLPPLESLEETMRRAPAVDPLRLMQSGPIEGGSEGTKKLGPDTMKLVQVTAAAAAAPAVAAAAAAPAGAATVAAPPPVQVAGEDTATVGVSTATAGGAGMGTLGAATAPMPPGEVGSQTARVAERTAKIGAETAKLVEAAVDHAVEGARKAGLKPAAPIEPGPSPGAVDTSKTAPAPKLQPLAPVEVLAEGAVSATAPTMPATPASAATAGAGTAPPPRRRPFGGATEPIKIVPFGAPATPTGPPPELLDPLALRQKVSSLTPPGSPRPPTPPSSDRRKHGDGAGFATGPGTGAASEERAGAAGVAPASPGAAPAPSASASAAGTASVAPSSGERRKAGAAAGKKDQKTPTGSFIKAYSDEVDVKPYGSLERLEALQSLKAARPRLVVGAAELTKAFAIEQLEVKVGRKDENDVVIPHLSLSGRHATIQFVGDGFALTDHGSKNHTYVNEFRLAPETPVRIESNTQVTFGAVACLFVYETEAFPDRPAPVRAGPERILENLVHTGVLAKAQAKEIERDMEATGQQLGETLILRGLFTPQRWAVAWRASEYYAGEGRSRWRRIALPAAVAVGVAATVVAVLAMLGVIDLAAWLP